MTTHHDNERLLKLNKSEQYKAAEELIEEARSDELYFLLLVLSSIIISAGALLANSAILIGGMLITPVLSPILLIALGIVTGKPRLITRSLVLVAKSVGIIFTIALFFGLIFAVPVESEFFDSTIFNNTLNAGALYFIVAFASGVAATFAWIRKEMSTMISGISIAVSLVPPIALVAVWLGNGHFDLARFFLFVFLFNVIGIIAGSMIVFSLMQFYRVAPKLSKKVDEVIKEEKKEKIEAEKEKEHILHPDEKSHSSHIAHTAHSKHNTK